MTSQQVLAELKAMGSEGTRRMLMKNHGVREPCFGVKIGDMKKIQKRIKMDYQLALDLYDSGNYDAMYLAGLIADDAQMTRKDLQRWVDKALGGCLAGTTVPTVAAQGRFGWELALKWIESPKGHIASAGWFTLSCLVALKEDDELDLAQLKQLVARVKQTMHPAPGDVRYAMNNFVISVGCHVKSLTKLALETGEKIGPVEADLGDNQCQIPFAPDYIRKVEQRGTIGKKRKTVKC